MQTRYSLKSKDSSRVEAVYEKKSYTVHDVLNAGYTLEPMVCLKCGQVGYVTFSQYVGDAYCEQCGEWQLD